MAKKRSKNNSSKRQQNGSTADESNIVPNGNVEAKQELVDDVNDIQNEVAVITEPDSEVNVQTEAIEEVSQESNDNKIKELQEQLESLRLELSQKDLNIAKLTKEKDNELDKLKDEFEKVSKENSSKEKGDESSMLSDLKQQLELKTEESNKYKENYDSLLSRLSQMKSVFSKMKDSESRLVSIESENKQLKVQLENSTSKVTLLESSVKELNSEVINLNSECDRLTNKNSELKEQVKLQDFELENESKQLEDENKRLKREIKEAKSDLEEYLILIQEEKMSKTNLNQELNDLKLKIENITTERKTADNKCKDLLLEITKLNEEIKQLKKDNEEIISNSKIQLDSKINQMNDFTNEINSLKTSITEKDAKLNTLQELENDLKEKQLLIGKLRHEAIILNEHLTKAMKLIKKESGKETVDRELVSNLFISFLQIPRGDTKKFEVLQLLANFLDWDDEKKRHAGLLSSANYKSHSNSVVEVPHPGRQGSQSNTQSFVSLWTEFLEKESTPKDQPV